MPATRRSRTSGGPATKGAQSTLSFGGRNKVTKAVPAASKLSKDIIESTKAEVVDIEPETQKPELGHVFSEAAVQKQAEIELSKPKSEEELLAEKVSDAQIKKYWKAREAERTTPRGINTCCFVNNLWTMD
jgi:DNA polymerase delta subunit 4